MPTWSELEANMIGNLIPGDIKRDIDNMVRHLDNTVRHLEDINDSMSRIESLISRQNALLEAVFDAR